MKVYLHFSVIYSLDNSNYNFLNIFKNFNQKYLLIIFKFSIKRTFLKQKITMVTATIFSFEFKKPQSVKYYP